VSSSPIWTTNEAWLMFVWVHCRESDSTVLRGRPSASKPPFSTTSCVELQSLRSFSAAGGKSVFQSHGILSGHTVNPGVEGRTYIVSCQWNVKRPGQLSFLGSDTCRRRNHVPARVAYNYVVFFLFAQARILYTVGCTKWTASSSIHSPPAQLPTLILQTGELGRQTAASGD
jgi:hypothetical protein